MMNKKKDESRHLAHLMELSAFFHRLFRIATEPARGGKTTIIRYYILKALEQKDKQNLTEISDALFLKKNALSQLLDRMVNDRLIERITDTNDRRKIILSITPNGRLSIEEFEKILIANMKKYAVDVPEKDRDEFIDAVETLVRILKKNRGEIDRFFAECFLKPGEF